MGVGVGMLGKKPHEN